MRRRVRRIVRRARAAIPVRPGGALVLMYHRVADLPIDPWRLAVHPAHFAEHLDLIARYLRPITAAGLSAQLDDGRIPARTVVVTMDDGYADLATAARPLLEAAGVPATMFVVSGAVDDPREFWWDALERALLGDHLVPPRLMLAIGGRELAWDVTATERERAYRSVWAALRTLPTVEREAAIVEVARWAGQPPEARPTHRTLRSDELAELARDGLVEIGGHTASHPSLGSLPGPDQAREIDDGRRQLEDRVGHRVVTLAYPYGRDPDVTTVTVAAARASGLHAAFTTDEGRVRTGDDRHALRRVFVDDLDGEGFARLLRRVAGLRVG